MVLEVYLDPCTVNSRKVLAGLELLGTEYHYNHVDYFAGEHKGTEYLKINPHATVPSARDNGPTITESNAILMYAADRDGGNSAYPKDLQKRAQVNRWLLWEASVWFSSCYVYLVEFVVKPLLKSEPDQAPTIADISIAASMHLHKAQHLPLDQHPQLKEWMTERVEKLACWQKTQAAVEKALLSDKATANGIVNEYTQIQSTLNYTKDLSPKRTELYFYDSNEAEGIHEPGDDAHEVTIPDGWHRGQDFSVDKEGFSSRNFHTGFDKWEDEETVRAEFYPEVVNFLKCQVGAKQTNTSQRAPVMLVHCDYTAESGPLRVRQLLGNEAEDLLSRRVAFINVWKPIRNIVEERPLAMCDVTTSPRSDFFKLYFRYRERTGENYVMRFSPRHKWWYFPKITPDHAILLKTYESENDGCAQFAGHSAFLDPTTRPDAPTRESIEFRTIAFF
ncbi:hypothetical protein EV356DRAFT_557283 [Viridothelium virens]|uniref:GST N-terminal domain-containing protein n=1 Tax=Viridothelium virens TaxID=1048519 RepID=A0A6A6HL41_VIRVR|nr:hypothetical protein EV356DRAFT_557283 [Viridothelium virens]